MPSTVHADLIAARERGKKVVLHTPVISPSYLSEIFSMWIVLKAENLQRTGAFKIRGLMNKLAVLGDMEVELSKLREVPALALTKSSSRNRGKQ